MPKPAKFIARAANISDVRRLLGVDVEIIANRIGIGRLQIQLERHREVVPVKVTIVEATSFKTILRAGETVQELCDRYNLAVHSLRLLRDHVERHFGFGRLPAEANAALPTITQLDSIVREREQRRLFSKLILIKYLKNEISFWEQLYVTLSSALAPALREISDHDRLMPILDGRAAQRRQSPIRELLAGAEARGIRRPPRLPRPRRSLPSSKAKSPR